MSAAATEPGGHQPATTTQSTSFGEKSYVVTENVEMAADIHSANVEQLVKMDSTDIMEQQNLLLSTLDPDLVKFLQSKRATQQSPQLQQPMEVISGKCDFYSRQNIF